MPKTNRFDGKDVKIPGAYALIKASVKNGFVNLPYGGLIMIDTGNFGAGFGGGAGIAGTLAKNGDAVYIKQSLQEMQAHVKGGLAYKLAEPLFFPDGINNSGVSYIEYLRACATVPAEISMTFVGGGSNGGSLVYQMRDEGIVGNGIKGDETRAVGTVSITAAGAGGDTIPVVAGSTTTLGSYLTVSGNSAAVITTALINAINTLTGTHGYEAVQLTSTSFKVLAPVNDGATANARTLTAAVTGGNGATTSTTAFAGGVNGTKLTRGYGAKMVAGTIDNTKFKIVFYRGTFTGLDTMISNGDPYDGVLEKNTVPVEVISTPEFSNLNDIQYWLQNDPKFNATFKLKTIVINGTGLVDATDLTNNTTLKLATGGTETYNSTHLDTALDYVKKSQASFILLDKFGTDAMHARNITIGGWNIQEARFRKILFVAGGDNEDQFDIGATPSSKGIARFYNSQYVVVNHGGSQIPRSNGSGVKVYSAIYTAALQLGRLAGIEPQNPITLKMYSGLQGLTHKMSQDQQEAAIDNGILSIVLDEDFSPARFVTLKGINSLQNNENILNEDSTTPSIQLLRIALQIDKELVINCKRKFWGGDNAVNRNMVSTNDILTFTQDFLSKKVGTKTQDNLLVKSGDNPPFQNIVVTVVQDAYYITFQITPNYEVNFMFFIGTMIDPTSN